MTWKNLTCSAGKMNQTRNYTQYDSNNCFAITHLQSDNLTNSTIKQYQLVGPSFVNTTWLENWYNFTACRINDTYIQRRNITQYDTFACALNKTYFDNRSQTCDYCKPNVTFTNWSNWQNINCSLVGKMNQSRIRVQYDKNNCFAITHLQNDSFTNITIKEYQLVGPSLTNTTWEDWHNISVCMTNDTFVQQSSLIQYDTFKCGSNTSFNRTQNLNCSYCDSNISEVLYTPWSECSWDHKMIRTEYFVDYNYDSCCAVTNLSSDCEFNLIQYRNMTEESPCELAIASPKSGVYTSGSFNINLSTIRKAYIDLTDFSNNKTKFTRLCPQCSDWGMKVKRTISLPYGNHSIVLSAWNSSSVHSEKNLSIIILDKDPQISSIVPSSSGYTNGSFILKYIEAYKKDIILSINQSNITINCTSKEQLTAQYCNFFINLTRFNNKTINYTLYLRDLANNTDSMKNMNIKVDTIVPFFSTLNGTWGKTTVKFNISLSERVNLDYFDTTWKSLCVNCDKYSATKTFTKFFHQIKIKAVDKAQNTVVTDLNLS